MSDKFWWFKGASVQQLAEELKEGGPDARLEVRIDAKKKMTFTIVGETYSGSVNDSHACPPQCPPK